MSKRAIHYDDWDGGTEADQDPPDTLMCGTESGDPQMTQLRGEVTCKRCLKIIESWSKAMTNKLEISRELAERTLKGLEEGLHESAPTVKELRALLAADPVDYPECSGTPESCPENEGYGCCKQAAPVVERQEPVPLTAVAVLRDDGDGGLEPEWLLEGGTAELFEGAVLLIADLDQTLCEEDGHCTLYREQPAPVAVVLPDDWQDQLFAEMERRLKLRKHIDDDHMVFDDTQVGVEFAIEWIAACLDKVKELNQ